MNNNLKKYFCLIYFFIFIVLGIFLENLFIFSISLLSFFMEIIIVFIKHYYRIHQIEYSIVYEPRLIKIKGKEIKIKDAINYFKLKNMKLEDITVEDLNLINILSY